MRNPFEGSQARLSRSCLTASMGLGGIATSAQMQRRRSRPRSGATSQLFRMTRIRAERSSRALGVSRHLSGNLATQDSIAISGFSRKPAFADQTEPNNDHYRYIRRIPTLPGRGLRAAAPDVAFGLFGNRHLPARTDLECVRCLRQAAL